MEELGEVLSESPFNSKILCKNEAMVNTWNLTWSKLYEMRVETDISSVWPNVSAAESPNVDFISFF